MSVILLIVTLPMMIFAAVLMGLSQLFTVFGMLYALPIFALIAGVVIAERYRKPKAAATLMLTAVIGPWLSFLSWLLSRRPLSVPGAIGRWGLDMPSIAKAGFPISALELPPPPMGSDHVPTDMWIGVFANHGVWILAALILAIVIVAVSKKTISARKLFPLSVVLAMLAIVSNLALFTIWYD